MNQTIVIVGASHAAVAAIEHLRRQGFTGRLIVVGDDSLAPYQRPPLSKKYLLGELSIERLAIRPPTFYAQHQVELRLNTRAIAIDRAQQHLTLSDGEALHYDTLLLCTGSRVRQLTCPGHGLAGVHYLRTAQDADRLHADMGSERRLVVIGAGYIGLEVAASARKLGMEVTVIEMTERCLNRVTSPVVSEFFARRHRAAGVQLRVNMQVAALLGDSRVTGVQCASGEVLPADVVLAGIGVVPNIELANAAGLDCDNGIMVDAHCRTSDPQIYAAGDCTAHPSARYGGRVRLESVDNAAEQARVAAANICGIVTEHAHVPWFWSEQFNLRLQTAGLLRDHDHQIVRGDNNAPVESAQFSVWYLKGSEIVAVDAVSRPGDFMLGKRWIGERKHVDGEQLANLAIDLSSL